MYTPTLPATSIGSKETSSLNRISVDGKISFEVERPICTIIILSKDYQYYTIYIIRYKILHVMKYSTYLVSTSSMYPTNINRQPTVKLTLNAVVVERDGGDL